MDAVSAILGEALTRVGRLVDLSGGFTANVVVPVTSDIAQREALCHALLGLRAKEVTLSNVIDEPLCGAVLYGKAATRPPVNKDILVFDAGAGTTDVAVVRYHAEAGARRLTVLGEQGRCAGGADIDRGLYRMLIERIGEATGVHDESLITSAVAADTSLGRVLLEDECESLKTRLAEKLTASFTRRRFLGQDTVEIEITEVDLAHVAGPAVSQMKDAAESVLLEARQFVEDFDGIDIVLLVGGTSRLPLVRRMVQDLCPKSTVVDNRKEPYFNEMVATVSGVGFGKDFEDLILKRPPYTVTIEALLQSGRVERHTLYRAFDRLYEWYQTFTTAVPGREHRFIFGGRIETLSVSFTTPAGYSSSPTHSQLPPRLFRGCTSVEARLDVKGRLTLRAQGIARSIKMPYFAQTGFLPLPEVDLSKMSLPPVYPAEN